MSAGGTISRDAPADVAQDYAALVAEGTHLLQDMTGAVWTNYNHSDPGVTILEQLCYALTELGYRADFPVADLLGAAGSGQIALPRQGLYPARAIMTSDAVTPDDLRRLVLDRLPDLANVWFTPLSPDAAGGNSGLYRIDVLARTEPCECDPPDPASLRSRVLDCYAAHRALCEDVQACRLLAPLTAHIDADVYLADGTDPDQALAQLQFAADMLFAPEPLRHSLEQQLAAGLPTTAIFDGPPMLNGFIGDDQLGPLPRALSLDDLLDTLAAVDGVLAVDRLRLRAGADPHVYQPGEEYDLPDGAVLRMPPPGRGAAPALRLFIGGVPCRTNQARIARLLERAWAAQRRTYPLPSAYREHYPAPGGSGQDLTAYVSVQQQFPIVYGIGDDGLPPEADMLRKAQARQLKGYLMPFDQLMADYFSQLGFVRDLYSVETGGACSYAWQSLAALVPDSAPLMQPDYHEGMAALVAAHDPARERQAAVLDFLLSLYGERLVAPLPEHDPGDGSARAAWEAAVLDAKRALLRRTVAATRERGRGFDYRRAGGPRNAAGMEIRCRIELALNDASAAALAEAADGPAPDDDIGHRYDPRHADLTAPARTQPLYIVEWVLLRYALLDEKRPLQADDMGFRICAVLPERRGRDGIDDDDDEDAPADDGWRERVRAILRANTPSHIVVDTLFLAPRRMDRFVPLYEDWAKALRGGSAERKREASRKLAHFLHPSALKAAAPAPVRAEVLALPPPTKTDVIELAPAPRAPAPGGVPAGHTETRLPGEAHAAPPGASGLHVHARIGVDHAQRLVELGYRFVLRDLGTPAAEPDALDRAEALAILHSGLALMPVQATPFIGWTPDAPQGRRDGVRAVGEARALGLPAGITLWLQLADPVPGGLVAHQLDAYCRAWRAAVAAERYLPGLYMPQAGPLDEHGLAALAFAHYWQQYACTPQLAGRGACMVRMAGQPHSVDGLPCDRHYIEADRRGATPAWLQASR